MLKKIKKCSPYISTVIFCGVILLCMLIPCLVQKGWGENYSIDAYRLLYLNGMGFWGVMTSIFECLNVILIILLLVFSFLEIAKEAKFIEFVYTNKKITTIKIIRYLLISFVVLSIIQIFFIWFLILGNKDYGLVFGAGQFIITALVIIFSGIFIFFDRNGYWKSWAGQPELEVKEEMPNYTETDETEIVVEPKDTSVETKE